MASLSRDVIRWLQSLDLSWQVKNPKWDFTNGYLVAEILCWYFPREISLHSYNNGKSIDSKLRNWHLLREFFKRHQFNLAGEIVDGTIHCKEEAAVLLVNSLFEILTSRSPMLCCEGNMDDFEYQNSLTLHARANASKSLKNNISSTEMKVQQDILTNQQKAQAILQRHTETRLNERLAQPQRFGISRSPGERCLRNHPGPNYDEQQHRQQQHHEHRHQDRDDGHKAVGHEAQPDRLRTDVKDRLLEDQPAAREIVVKQQPKYAGMASE